MSCTDDGHCITCSDEALPMRVMRLASAAVAVCSDESGATSEVMLDLVGPVAAGDWVLVHAGAALQLVENAERFRP